MSTTISIATLPRMSRDALSALLSTTGTESNSNKLAIIDVRDSGMTAPFLVGLLLWKGLLTTT